MRVPFRTFLIASFLFVAVFGCMNGTGAADTETVTEPLVVFLVRHGEKVDASSDPELSTAGHSRAAALADALRDARLEHVHSSDYTRTRDTAAPTAEALGLDVQLYDPRDLKMMAVHLVASGGRHLVVGHSNTTPALVELLGGEAGTKIDEPAEYDRLYIVTRGKDGTASSVLLRYGAPYKP